MRLLLTAVALLAWAGPASALECYACRGERQIKGIALSAAITSRLATFPKCTEMAAQGASAKFEQKCAAGDKGCVNIVDPADAGNRLRSCFPLARDECKAGACYCKGDLCNGAAGGWASALAVAAALLALHAGR